MTPELLIESIYYHAWATASQTNLGLLKSLRDRFGTLECAWKHATNHLLATIASETDIVRRKTNTDPRKEWEKLEKSAIHLILQENPDYPEPLKQLPHPPMGIYVQGNFYQQTLAQYTPLSVVGTRRPSPYGIIQTQRIIQALAGTQTLIISGLAHGIDTIAHETALLENLPTWAVIGHGHNIFSYSRMPLVKLILESNLGCIISEYAPDTPALAYHFPQRNRIIAGLSPYTLVTEAPIKSGALITAHSAFETNREVFALTADIDRTDCAGNLDLIERSIATPITSYAQLPVILHNIAKNSQQSLFAPTVQLLDANLQKIIDTLTYKHATPVSQLLESTKIPTVSLLFQKLSELEIEGFIEQVPGGYKLKK